MAAPGWKLPRAGVFMCETHNPPRRRNRVNTLVAVKRTFRSASTAALSVFVRGRAKKKLLTRSSETLGEGGVRTKRERAALESMRRVRTSATIV